MTRWLARLWAPRAADEHNAMAPLLGGQARFDSRIRQVLILRAILDRKHRERFAYWMYGPPHFASPRELRPSPLWPVFLATVLDPRRSRHERLHALLWIDRPWVGSLDAYSRADGSSWLGRFVLFTSSD